MWLPLKKVSLFSSVFFLLLSNSSCSFSSKTQQKLFNKAANEQYDAIIVPGVPFENGQWSRVMKARVYWSKYLFSKGIAKNIIYSGSAVYSPYYEGKIMALYAEALGVPAANIYSDTLAEHSTENVYYSYKLAKKLGFARIALASDPFQTKLLGKFARKKFDPPIALIPFVIDTLKAMEPGMVDPVIDSTQAFKPAFISIKDRESFGKRWRGTRGKNINASAYD
jgi:uncharacterized SAM-binding protein YcdF (DUF218 family)